MKRILLEINGDNADDLMRNILATVREGKMEDIVIKLETVPERETALRIPDFLLREGVK